MENKKQTLSKQSQITLHNFQMMKMALQRVVNMNLLSDGEGQRSVCSGGGNDGGHVESGVFPCTSAFLTT